MKWRDLMHSPCGAIVSVLAYGKRNAKSQRRIAAAFGISEREVRKAIEYVRCNSDPADPETKIIASGREGYYIAETLSEVLAFYNMYHSRALTNESACRCARAFIERETSLDPDGDKNAVLVLYGFNGEGRTL